MIPFILGYGVVAMIVVLIWIFRQPVPRWGDHFIRCPTCGTTWLAQYGMGLFQRSFECENGHRFSVPDEGP